MTSSTSKTASPSTTAPITGSTSRRRHLTVAVAAVVVGAGLLAAVGCSSGAADAAPRASDRPASTAPTATASPPTTAAANGARLALLQDVLDTHHAAGEFVGARIALRDRDGTITETTAGTATVDPGAGPVDPDVAWNIGSVTKTFVAVVVLQLADEGAIDLDGGIDAWFPDLAGADRITVRQLLQHTSGLGEYGDKPAVLADPQRVWTPAELIAVAEGGGRVGEPGEAHHYSNTNYIVAGEIIRKVTGHDWADEVRTRIAEPLGLTHTSGMTDERPIGYKLVDGAFVEATSSAHPSLGGAAGAMQSTGRDLLRFATALADGSLLSPTSQAAMRTFVPAEDLSQFGIVHGYGLGLERYELDAITVDGHMGTGEAQSAYVGWDTERGTAVAVMTNTAIPGPPAIMAVEALIATSQTG